MKSKWILGFVLVFVLATLAPQSAPICYAQDVTYYRVTENTPLFKTASFDEDNNNILFELPKTYFVKLVEEINDETLKVCYDGIEGFVKAENVMQCYSTPTTPYASNLTVDILNVCNVVVYATPSAEGDFVGIIPFNATKIKFFGEVCGNEVLEELGNTWLYVRYQSFEQGTIYGYVYAPLCTNKSEIVDNLEEVETTPPQNVVETSVVPVSGEFKNTDSMFLIVGLSILALVILYLLFKPERRRKVNKSTKNLTPLPAKRISYIEKHTENDEFDF